MQSFQTVDAKNCPEVTDTALVLEMAESPTPKAGSNWLVMLWIGIHTFRSMQGRKLAEANHGFNVYSRDQALNATTSPLEGLVRTFRVQRA